MPASGAVNAENPSCENPHRQIAKGQFTEMRNAQEPSLQQPFVANATKGCWSAARVTAELCSVICLVNTPRQIARWYCV
jgi:hypothetical protein